MFLSEIGHILGQFFEGEFFGERFSFNKFVNIEDL